jgi:hypothetical protein
MPKTLNWPSRLRLTGIWCKNFRFCTGFRYSSELFEALVRARPQERMARIAWIMVVGCGDYNMFLGFQGLDSRRHHGTGCVRV